MEISRKLLVHGNTDYYEFSVIPNTASTHLHIYLDKYYRTRPGRKILADSPRWAREDERFSTIDSVDVPQDVIDEVRETLIKNMEFHLT